MSVTMIGLDTAKAVFHVHGVDGDGKAQFRRVLRRRELVGFFEAQPPARWYWRRAGPPITGSAC